MIKIHSLIEREKHILIRLLAIWESAVKNTHTFLSESDLAKIKPEVYEGLKTIEVLVVYTDDMDILQGFIGVAKRKIEMLFIDGSTRGQGIGKQLLHYAVDKLDAKFVDVNEQNEQGAGFYKHMGFEVLSRSEHDEQGRPFPLLRLELRKNRH